MTKFRSSILIFGSIILCIATALATFLVLSATGMLVTDPIELTFGVHDCAKEYDGTPLTVADGDWTLLDGQLLEGHSYQCVPTGSQTEVGESISGLNVKILDKKGFDVTSTYSICVTPGVLTVNQRVIGVKQRDVVVEYDGQPHYADTFDVIEGTLVAGHRLVADPQAEGVTDVTPSGGMMRDSIPKVYDAVGNDVTDNYALTEKFVSGTVTVVPRALQVVPLNAEKVYDGKKLTATQYEIRSGSLLSGHSLSVSFGLKNDVGAPELVDVGTVEVTINGLRVSDATGRDVSSNYELMGASSATLTVKKATATVSLGSTSVQYGSRLPDLLLDQADIEGIVEDDRQFLEIGYMTSAENPTSPDCGDYPYTVSWKADTTVGNNYNLTVRNGVVTVNPQTVSFPALPALSRGYGEDRFSNVQQAQLGTILGTVSALQDCVRFTYPAEPKTAVGTYPYTLDWIEPPVGTTELETYTRVRKNYRLQVTPSTLTVIKAGLTIAYDGNGVNKIYDGKPAELEYDKFTLSAGDLKVVSASIPKIVHVNESRNAENKAVISDIVLYDKELKQDVTANYDFGIVSTTVTIRKRALTLSVKSDLYLLNPIFTSKENLPEGTLSANPDDETLTALYNYLFTLTAVSSTTPLVEGEGITGIVFQCNWKAKDDPQNDTLIVKVESFTLTGNDVEPNGSDYDVTYMVGNVAGLLPPSND